MSLINQYLWSDVEYGRFRQTETREYRASRHGVNKDLADLPEQYNGFELQMCSLLVELAAVLDFRAWHQLTMKRGTKSRIVD